MWWSMKSGGLAAQATPVRGSGSEVGGLLLSNDLGGLLVDGKPELAIPVHRVTVPGRVTRYLNRPELVGRCMPTNKRVTVLKAPGGFGKTTLLSECCRVLAARGVPVAWLSLEDDDAAALEIGLVVAFQHAGLDVLEPFRGDRAGPRPPYTRMAGLLLALEAAGGCVLALDELERVTNPQSVALLNGLVRAASRNVHLALACRKLPTGLDIAEPVLAGEAEIVTVEDLRFSRDEIARYFASKLSRRELSTVAAESAGWPIALHVRRTAGARPVDARERVVRDVVDNWMESRLWYDVADGDRELLLDAGLFDWMDADLLDEVLEGVDLMRRLSDISGVRGLVEVIRRGARKVWRLHPLIREHCAEWRRRETPARYRSVHRRLAGALAGRGETVPAMRHALEAGDAALAGSIFSEAGGVRLLLRVGADGLLAADRFVSDEVLALYPRLVQARVVALAMRGRMPEARRVFESASAGLVGGRGDPDLEADRSLAWGVLLHNGGASLASDGGARSLIAAATRIADTPGMEPIVAGAMEYGLSLVHGMKAEFAAAEDRGARARRLLGKRSPILMAALDFQDGQVAMAQGQVRNAEDWYRRGLDRAKRLALRIPGLASFGQCLVWELDLERNRIHDDAASGRVPHVLRHDSLQFAAHAAATAVAAELMLRTRGVDAALVVVDEMWEAAYRAELATVLRCLVGLRVALLAEAGRVGEAERQWRTAGLPSSDEGCVDLVGQSWREMEALSCARVRLRTARGDFDDGRRLVRRLDALASERGLRRTRMRALALAMAIEVSAGRTVASVRPVEAFLGLYGETDYAHPLVREGEAATVALEAYLDRGAACSPHRVAAEALHAAARIGSALLVPSLSARELQVLARLDSQTDREIGATIGLTVDGVRYHVKRLFEKLDARDRHDACHRARALGIVLPEPQRS